MPPTSPARAPVSAAAGEFGKRVRERRAEMGLSQEGLAEVSDLHWSYIGQVERGQVNATLHNILRIAQALNCSAGDLITGLTPPPREESGRTRTGRKPRS